MKEELCENVLEVRRVSGRVKLWWSGNGDRVDGEGGAV